MTNKNILPFFKYLSKSKVLQYFGNVRQFGNFPDLA